ncbi:MAG: RICIN domain-containing protein [Pseudomonadota bacterium]
MNTSIKGVTLVCMLAISGSAAVAGGYEGRISLVGKLDEPDGLCIDLPGPPFRLMLDRPAWVHTCKPGDVRDMILLFDGTQASPIKSTLVEPALCMEADNVAAGSLLHFVECNQNSNRQTFRYIKNGQIRLDATTGQELELCLSARTAATVPFGEPPNNDDPNGHSMIVNLERSHVARPLELRDCATAPLEVSQWEAYQEQQPKPFR